MVILDFRFISMTFGHQQYKFFVWLKFQNSIFRQIKPGFNQFNFSQSKTNR
jgi:hypothetical protein